MFYPFMKCLYYYLWDVRNTGLWVCVFVLCNPVSVWKWKVNPCSLHIHLSFLVAWWIQLFGMHFQWTIGLKPLIIFIMPYFAWSKFSKVVLNINVKHFIFKATKHLLKIHIVSRVTLSSSVLKKIYIMYSKAHLSLSA